MSNRLFQVDSLAVDGEPLPIGESSVTLEGALGFEREGQPSASGQHYSTRKKIVPQIKGKVQLHEALDARALDFCNAQVVLRQDPACGDGDSRRVRCSKCETATLGTIGDGPVEIEINVLGEIEWL